MLFFLVVLQGWVPNERHVGLLACTGSASVAMPLKLGKHTKRIPFNGNLSYFTQRTSHYSLRPRLLRTNPLCPTRFANRNVDEQRACLGANHVEDTRTTPDHDH